MLVLCSSLILFCTVILSCLGRDKVMLVGVACGAIGLYSAIGGWSEVFLQSKMQHEVQKVKQSLQSEKGSDKLISQLEAIVKAKPDDVEGLYWLARVYAHKGEWSKVLVCMEHAYKLAPELKVVAVAYAEALTHNQQGARAKRIIAKWSQS